MSLKEEDFTYTEDDITHFKSLTDAQKKQVILAAYPHLTSESIANIKSGFGNFVSLCGHKKEKIKRAMDSLGL